MPVYGSTRKRFFADVNGNCFDCFRPIDCTLTKGFDMSFLKAVDRFIPTEMEDDQDNKCQNTHSVPAQQTCLGCL